MRAPRLSARDRRALVAAAAVLLPLLAWTLVAAPYRAAVAEARETLEAERAALSRERGLMAAARAYPDEFAAGAERLLAEAPRLVGGADDGAAAAALARYVRAAAREARVHLTRVEPAPSADAGGGVTALPLEVAGQTDLEGLMTLLQLLEGGAKLVRVDGVRVEARERTAATAPDPHAAFFAPALAPADVPETLTVRLRLVGYTLAADPASLSDGAEP